MSLISSVSASAEKLIGEKIVSPDKKFSVSVEALDNETKIVVRNNQTQVIETSFFVPVIPLVLEWAPNSKAVSIIIHISGGSVGGIIRYVNHQWKYSLLEPPTDERCSFSVIKTDFKKEFISYKYRVVTEKNNGEKVASYLCTFDVNLTTGVMTNIKAKPFDESME
jgi:hypothetical protein